MVRTRRSPIDDEASVDGMDAETTVEEGSGGAVGPPPSNHAFDRKLVVVRDGLLDSACTIHTIRHPKLMSGVLFRIGDENCDEVLVVEDEIRCLFVGGNSVVSDGRPRIFSPFHALFIALPYLLKKKSRFEVLEEILIDEEFPAVSQLAKCKQLHAEMEKVADLKDVCSERVIRYNEEKAKEWLTAKFAILKAALQENVKLHESIAADEAVLARYCFGVLCEYLPAELAMEMKEELKIVDGVKGEEGRESLGTKRRVQESGDENAYSPAHFKQPPAKKAPVKSAAQKKLEGASKGTKSLSSFFTKKS